MDDSRGAASILDLWQVIRLDYMNSDGPYHNEQVYTHCMATNEQVRKNWGGNVEWIIENAKICECARHPLCRSLLFTQD